MFHQVPRRLRTRLQLQGWPKEAYKKQAHSTSLSNQPLLVSKSGHCPQGSGTPRCRSSTASPAFAAHARGATIEGLDSQKRLNNKTTLPNATLDPHMEV